VEPDQPVPVTRVAVSPDGALALPESLLRRLGIENGGAVHVTDLGHAVLIEPADRPSTKLEGIRAIVDAALDAGLEY